MESSPALILTTIHVASIQDHLRNSLRVLSVNERATRVSNLDEILRACEYTMCALKSKRNQYTDVSQVLPDEILEKVFMDVIDYTEGSFACLPLGRVCRRWRDVALGSPRLWSHIPIRCKTNLKALREVVQRAKLAPLTVDFPNDDWEEDLEGEDDDDEDEDDELRRDQLRLREEQVFKCLLPLITRMNSFRMGMTEYRSSYRLIRNSTAVHAPHLVSVDLNLSGMDDTAVPFLSGDLPVLRHVVVSLQSLGPTLPLLRPTLVTLHMYVGSYNPPHPPSHNNHASALLASLRSMPLLEELWLSTVISSTILLTFSDWRPIQLPCLTRLHVADFASPMDKFLHCLRLPPTTDSSVIVMPKKGDEHDHTSILAGALASIAHSLEQGTGVGAELPFVICLSFEVLPDHTISCCNAVDWRARALKSTTRADGAAITSNGRLSVTFPPKYMSQQEIDALLFAFPLQRVFSVEFDCSDHFPNASSSEPIHREGLVSFLQHTESVRSLILNGWCLPWLRSLLIGPLDSQGTAGMLKTPSALETLKIVFQPELVDSSRNPQSHFNWEVTMLLQTLQKWTESHGSLKTIELSSWGEHFTKAHAEMLRSGLGSTVVIIIRE